MKTLKVSTVVLDFDLYPRQNMDSQNVRHIASAMECGVELPPIVIDRKSKRVIDGFHRVRATQRTYGDEAKIQCIEKTYNDEQEMFLDAMRYNAGHGAKLDSADRTRCTHIAEKLELSLDAVAGALNMPVDKLANLNVDRTAKSGKLNVPLKRTVRHFHGRKLNKRQQDANKKLSGMNQQFYANQLIELIEAEMLDTEDGELMGRLRVLHGLLDGVLAAKQ